MPKQNYQNIKAKKDSVYLTLVEGGELHVSTRSGRIDITLFGNAFRRPITFSNFPNGKRKQIDIEG